MSCRHSLLRSGPRGVWLVPVWRGEPRSCALDVVEACGPLSLSDVGALVGLTPQGIAALEARVLERLRDSWELD